MKSLAIRLYKTVGKWLYKLSWVGLVRLSEQRVIHGLRVVVTTLDEEMKGDEEAAFDRVRDALDLIDSVAPHRFRRMRRDLRLIWVRPHPMCRASYDPVLGACVVDLPNFVLNPEFALAEIAASIVHEATHARLVNAGFDYQADLCGDRIERICRKAELGFGRRLPQGGEAVVERAGQILAQERASLSRDELREARRRAAAIELQDLGVHRWVKWLLKRTWRSGP